MFPWIITVVRDVQQLENFRPRGFAGILKRGLQFTARLWHRKYMKLHFKRTAYHRYPDDYPKPKRRGLPFVATGSLRKYMLKTPSKGKKTGGGSYISGPAMRVRLTLRYGRPGNPSEEVLKLRIFVEWRLHPGWSYKQAETYVYRTSNYSKQVREKFQRGIANINNQEARFLAKQLKRYVVKELNKRGRKRKGSIRGAGGRFVGAA